MSVYSKVRPNLKATAWAQGPGRYIWKRGQFRLQDGVLSFTDDTGKQWFSVKAKDAQPEFWGGPLHQILVHAVDGKYAIVLWQNPYVMGLFIPKPYAALKLRQVVAPWKEALSEAH